MPVDYQVPLDVWAIQEKNQTNWITNQTSHQPEIH